MSVLNIKTSQFLSKRGGVLIFSALLMGGCSQQRMVEPAATVKPKPSIKVSTKEAAWAKRQQQLQAASSWGLDGKVAMRYKTDNWSFGVKWSQQGAKNSTIDIKNPFTGATVALIKQNNNSVSLKSSDGNVYTDTNAEKLLKKQAGISLPLDGLVYWARGIMAPQYPKGQVILDNAGRPKQITQASWVIKYPRYVGTAYNSLPKKIVLTRKVDEVYVNMVAKKWNNK